MDLGEADRLLTLLTPKYGKVRAIAKGVRRPQSRKAGHLEPFTRSSLLLARGRELDIITQAEALEHYSQLKADLLTLSQAAYVVELLDRFAVEATEGENLYQLLLNTLERLDGGGKPEAVIRYFEIRLLDLVGFRPELFQCVSCGREIQAEDQYFSLSLGGVLCPACGEANQPDSLPLSLAALKVLRHYQRSTYAAATRPRIRAEVSREIENLMEEYLTYILEQKLKVPSFVREVRRLIAGRQMFPLSEDDPDTGQR